MKNKLLNKLLQLTLGTALVASLGTNTRAGSFLWDFDDWLTPGGPADTLTYAGDANAMLFEDYKGLSEGNPATGGFLQLTPAVDSRNLAVAFPDIDDGAPIKAFKLTMDVRAGNPGEIGRASCRERV